MRLVYISGPYTPRQTGSPIETLEHINRAREAAILLAQAGIGFICPHLNTASFELYAPTVPYEFYMDLDLHLVRLADAILMLPGYEASHGALLEYAEAQTQHLPIFFCSQDKGRLVLPMYLFDWQEEPTP